MTNKRYTLLAEGIVENEFIPELLNKISIEKGIKFVRSSTSIKSSASPSKSKVIKEINKFVKQSIIIEEEDLFIVGVDLDEADHDLSKLNEQEKILKTKIGSGIDMAKVVIFVPVQAFDYWLLYQKYKINKHSKTNDNSLESKLKKDIKQELYGTSKPDTFVIKKTTKKILEILDAEELSKQSKSFNHFYLQLKNHI